MYKFERMCTILLAHETQNSICIGQPHVHVNRNSGELEYWSVSNFGFRI